MKNVDKKFQTKNVVTVASLHTLHDTFASFYEVILPTLEEYFGFGDFVASMLLIIKKIPALLNPLVGYIADKFAIRSAVIIAPLITIVLMSLLGLSSSIIILGVMLFVCGVSSTVFHVTTPILMRQVSGKNIGRGMSAFMVGGEVARTLAPLIIVAAVAKWGIMGTWRLIPFGITASFIVFLKLRTINKIYITPPEKKANEPIKKMLIEATPFFLTLTPIIFFRNLCKTSLTSFLTLYLCKESGFSMIMAGFALSLTQLFGAIGALLSGEISDRFGRKKVLLVVMILSPILMLLFCVSSGIMQWILLACMGFVFFSTTPIFMALVQEQKNDRPSFILSIYMLFSFSASTAVVFLIGVLSHHFGLLITYQVTALLSFGAIPLVLLIKESSQK